MDWLDLLDGVGCRAVRAELVTGEAFGAGGGAASDLRGALGKALWGGPWYDALFEPALPPDGAPRGLLGGSGAPRPFVLRGPEPRGLPEGGGVVRVEVVSFRTDVAVMEAWGEALERAAADGFGEPRARFRCREAAIGRPWLVGERARERWEEVARGRAEARVRIRLLCPVRVLSEGRLQAPTLPVLVNQALKRAQSLGWLYGAPPGERDFSPALRLAERVQAQGDVRAELHWPRLSRHSHSQHRAIPLDGVEGWLEASVPRALGLVLLAAEDLHVGKGTTQGLGRVRLEAEGDGSRDAARGGPASGDAAAGGVAPEPRARFGRRVVPGRGGGAGGPGGKATGGGS